MGVLSLADGIELALVNNGYPSFYYQDVQESLGLDRYRAFGLAVGQGLQLNLKDDHYLRISPPYAAAVTSLAVALRTRLRGPETLSAFRTVRRAGAGLLLLKIAVLAGCTEDLEPEVVSEVLEEADQSGVAIPARDLMLICAPHAGFWERYSELSNGAPAGDEDLTVAKFIDLVGSGPSRKEIADSPEGKALLGMPPELALRCVAALAESYDRRTAREA
jgi:hypothetical protein